MQEKDLAPWEVPPDESYWHALLQEEDDGEARAVIAVHWDPETGIVGAAAAESDLSPVEVPAPAVESGTPASTSPPPAIESPALAVESLAPAEPTPLPAPDVVPRPDSPPVEGAAEGAQVPNSSLDLTDSVPTLADEPSERYASATEPVSRAIGVEPADPPPEMPAPPSHTSDSWELFCRHRDAGTAVELTVESYNRGGLLVRWEQVVGFVPASQLCDGLRYGDEQTRLEDLATRVGTLLTLKVIEVDPEKNRLILSERAARHVVDPDLNVLDELNPGDVCPGEVTNLCTFGAFVDLGGVEGLIHISELSWGRVAHPADILQSGQAVEVYVLNVDRDQGRVGLSLKRLQPDPWSSVDDRYHVGQVTEGKVTNIVNFGAFVRLEEGLEGLIHTSELSGTLSSGPHALYEGAHIFVRINSIESERHRIGLSLEDGPAYEGL